MIYSYLSSSYKILLSKFIKLVLAFFIYYSTFGRNYNAMENLEDYFCTFREETIGYQHPYKTINGKQTMLYADWIASGRLYQRIENKIMNDFGPFVANTHTETSETGTLMTKAYHFSHQKIKEHVHANKKDVIITAGFGMTAVVNKFQRILGLKTTNKSIKEEDRPIVFVTHMEHHSNHTSWYATICDVVVVPAGEDLLVDPNLLKKELEKYKDRKFKIGAFTAASNVTGIITPYYELAKIMHEYGGVVLIDFAASAPYVDIDMHPKDPMEQLDAIVFSPHKFLGGTGASGVLIFDSALYHQDIPDHPGGGTVEWTNAWGEYKFYDDIELREDGGTPGFLQSIRAALAIELKEKMGVVNILEREHQLIDKAMSQLSNIEGIHVLASEHKNRIGAISFYHDDIHYNLIVKLLSDRYGVQVRGGCACAGTYGHVLLGIDYKKSHLITDKINRGDLTEKPGFVRLSIHPIMTNRELELVINAIRDIVINYKEYQKDYIYFIETNEFHSAKEKDTMEQVKEWFKI